jgi:transcription elongation factor GreA
LQFKGDCVKIPCAAVEVQLCISKTPHLIFINRTNYETKCHWGLGKQFYLYFTGDKMPPSFLTASGYQRLQDELEQLRTVKRQEVAARLREAMEDGGDMGVDLDAEYEAAKNEQAFVEGRIQELEMLLANARVIENSGKRETVEIGATVTIKEGRSTPEVYTLVGRAEANPREGRISNESPLGRAIIDHKVGDKVQVEAPGGAFEVQIVKVE